VLVSEALGALKRERAVPDLIRGMVLAGLLGLAASVVVLNLGTVLLAGSGLFCLATLFFGTKGGYYDSDDYDGNGTAH
jgi:hypothetical protein